MTTGEALIILAKSKMHPVAEVGMDGLDGVMHDDAMVDYQEDGTTVLIDGDQLHIYSADGEMDMFFLTEI